MPGFDAFAVEHVHDFAVERGIEDGLLAVFAQEDRDGDAPDALAADAPVRACSHHVGDSILAPFRVPDHLVDLLNGELAEGGFGAVGAVDRGFEADEPLLRGAEDDGMMAAPAVRVGVLQGGGGQQGAVLLEHGDDDGVGGPDGFAFKGGRDSEVPSAFIDVDTATGIDAAGGVEAVALAGVEVVGAMGGSGVDGARALVGGDVGGQNAEDAAVEERVLEGGAFELGAFEAGQFDGFAEIAGGDDGGGEFGGDDVDGGGVVSHPCAQKRAQGWGTRSLWGAREVWRARGLWVSGGGLGFVVSHPCAQKRAQGWGTRSLWGARGLWVSGGGVRRQRDVVEVGMEGDGEGRGEGPGGGGPDDGVDFAAFESGVERLGRRRELVAHVDRGTGVHRVLHLGFRQGGARRDH